MITSYAVTGMTCHHCAAAITEEVEAVEGVTSVEVSFEAGTLEVGSENPIDPDRIRQAVHEAGDQYSIA